MSRFQFLSLVACVMIFFPIGSVFAATITLDNPQSYYLPGDTITVSWTCDSPESYISFGADGNVLSGTGACPSSESYDAQTLIDNYGEGDFWAFIEPEVDFCTSISVCLTAGRPFVSFQVLSAAPSSNNAVWGEGGLFGTSTNVAATVASGVQETGKAIWPLLIILGTLLAFVIAMQTQDFIMAMMKQRRLDRIRDEYHSALASEDNIQKQWDITERYKKARKELE